MVRPINYPSLLLVLTTIGAVSGLSSSNLSDVSCQYDIVESMPDKLEFKTNITFQPTLTHQALIEMIENTKTTLRIASFYLTLTAEPEFASHPSANPGKNIMEAIVAASKRNVNIEVVLDHSSSKSMSNVEDVKRLKSLGVVKFVNMKQLLKSGVLHTKFMIADNETFYLGSSNFDWRSYTQIKEIGIRFTKCPILAQDLNKIFEVYMLMADQSQVPATLPEYLNTSINIEKPLNLKLDNNFNSKIFLSASPPAFNGVKKWTGRTDDIDGLLKIINKAHKFIDISVMNYSPTTEFMYPRKFWPRIDDALRRAASERNVRVRLLFSDWSHAKEEELMWYKSLNAVQSNKLKGSIHVKMFKVPEYDQFQKSIPFARVKHDKYMVTDNGLFIGTSNWSPDYFINTCGVSVVIEASDEVSNGSIISNMQKLFERDFSSEHSREL